MKKTWITAWLGGWLVVACAAEKVVLAADPPLAGPSGASGRGMGESSQAERHLPSWLGLMAIFNETERGAERPSEQPRVLILSEGSKFQKSGDLEKGRGARPASRESVRTLLRNHFYNNLQSGVAILDRTLFELGQRRGQHLRLTRAERHELADRVDRAIHALVSNYHSEVTGRKLFDSALTLARARREVYQQIFSYLAESTADENMRDFMQTHFEPAGAAGFFVPRPGARAEFLAVWTKQFERQPADVFFPTYLSRERWLGLVVAYHREIAYFREELGAQITERGKAGLESFLSLLIGWGPREEVGIGAPDRLALQKLAVLPFRVPEAHEHFLRDLRAIAGRDMHLAGYSASSYWPVTEMPAALAALRQRSDFLRALPAVERPAEAAEPPQVTPPAPAVASLLQQIFREGTPVAQLRRHLDTTTFAGLVGAQSLQRLQQSTVVLEATLAAMGIFPQGAHPERLQRLTALLCEGYEQYPFVATTEQRMVAHLRFLEEAYWKEVGLAYPEAVLQGKVTEGFLPTPEATEEFLREFSRQAKGKEVPELSIAETSLLQQTLGQLQTKEGVVEVVHLLLARGKGYQPGALPALDQVRAEMREYELHPSWAGKRSVAISKVIRELAVIYHTYPRAAQLRQIEPLLQRLLAVDFGLEAPALADPPSGAGGSQDVSQVARTAEKEPAFLSPLEPEVEGRQGTEAVRPEAHFAPPGAGRG